MKHLNHRETKKLELKRHQTEKSKLKRRDGFNGFEVGVAGRSLGRRCRARLASTSAGLRECEAELEKVSD